MNKEIESVLKISKQKKYEYFIKKVVDFEELWSIKDQDGWATVGDEDEMAFPIWPRKEFSDLYIKDEWINYQSEPIDLYNFIENWIPGMKKDGMEVAIFWSEESAIQVDLDALKANLEFELENY